MKRVPAAERLFIGCFPTGLVYADRAVEEHGDYRRLAYLNFGTLEPKYERNIPPELRALIESDVAQMQARRGQDYQVSECGQTVLLGYVPKSYLP